VENYKKPLESCSKVIKTPFGEPFQIHMDYPWMALENLKGPLKNPLEDYKDCLWIALSKL